MSSRTSIRAVVWSASLIPAALVAGLIGGLGPSSAVSPVAGQTEVKPQPKAAQPGAGRHQPSEDEKAIRAVDETFLRDYNKADSKALAACFTEDAEVEEANGERYQGRDVIEQGFADVFSSEKGSKLAFEIGAIKFLSPDAAKEEGRSIVTPAKGAPVSRLYTVIYVKRGDGWLIASVREEPDPRVRPHDRLAGLEWLIGDWVDEGSDSIVHVNCRWSEDENFLIRSYTVKRQGKSVLTVTQRIGWDPLAHQIRSWEFDSEGGFGEGKWSRDGERWVVKHEGVRPEGTTASATNIMSRERPDLVRWISTHRVMGDESVPDDDGYTLVRVPPAPKLVPKGQGTPASDTTRKPR